MAIRIRNNKNIKGINIKDTEFKISQFADDTSVFLDGSDISINETLTELSWFANISGLNVNFEKTQIIWIGIEKNDFQAFLNRAWLIKFYHPSLADWVIIEKN